MFYHMSWAWLFLFLLKNKLKIENNPLKTKNKYKGKDASLRFTWLHSNKVEKTKIYGYYFLNKIILLFQTSKSKIPNH